MPLCLRETHSKAPFPNSVEMPWTPSATHLPIPSTPSGLSRARRGVIVDLTLLLSTQPELRHGSCLEHLGEDALLLIQFDNTRGRGDPVKKFVSRSFPSLHYDIHSRAWSISPMRVFGGFFVPCIGLEGAFPLPYANGHARKSMHAGF